MFVPKLGSCFEVLMRIIARRTLRDFASASVVSAERMVFNIKGNDYRLVVAADFEKAIVWIKWIGTHKDYDKINVKDIDCHG